MHSLLQPGDHVIYTAPAYQSLYEVARALGCAVTPWYLQPDGDHWTLAIDQLEQMVTQRTKLLVINFPHNPTGYLPTSPVPINSISLAMRCTAA